MSNNSISGIYGIKNLINGKIYIGKSTRINRRFYEHRRELNKNEHHNIYLQRSWNKYGEVNFEFTIIEECVESELNNKEIYYISLFNSNSMDSGFNMTTGGDGSVGLKHSEETRKKISEIQLGRKLTDEWKKNISDAHKGKIPKNIDIFLERNKEISKEIVQIHISDKSISFWNSIQECARQTGIFATNIVKCLKGQFKTAGGSIFFYKENFNQNEIDIDELIKTRTMKRKLTKGVVKLSLSLDFIEEYSSMKELDEIGYLRQYIRLCCINKIDSYKGFKWMYKKDYDDLLKGKTDIHDIILN